MNPAVKDIFSLGRLEQRDGGVRRGTASLCHSTAPGGAGFSGGDEEGG